MTGRVAQMVSLTEQVLLLKPAWQRKVAATLLNFLRIRKDWTYEAGMEDLVYSAREMQKDPKLETESDLLLSEAEIAGQFTKLTGPEAEELEKYFVSLLLKGENSLAAHLAKALNGQIGDYWNISHFRDSRIKEFAAMRSMDNADDEDREEDFALRVAQPVSCADIFRVIKEHYIRQGYRFVNESLRCSVMLQKEEKFIAVVVTNSGTEILVTVNVLKT